MRMVNISNEKSMQSYTARCSRYKNKYTNLVCGKTAVGRNYNLPRDIYTHIPNDGSVADIQGVQGRYFLPIFLFLPLILKNSIIQVEEKNKKYVLLALV